MSATSWDGSRATRRGKRPAWCGGPKRTAAWSSPRVSLRAAGGRDSRSISWRCCRSTGNCEIFAKVPVRDQAENFEHHGGADQGGVSGLIVRRGNLYDIAADEIQSAQSAQHALRFPGG